MCSGEVGTDVDSLFYSTISKALFMEAMEWIWLGLQVDKQVHVAYKLSVVGKLKDCSLLIQESQKTKWCLPKAQLWWNTTYPGNEWFNV